MKILSGHVGTFFDRAVPSVNSVMSALGKLLIEALESIDSA
ncbi:hypothetical protein [uncultured Propionibacterium sp.]|nr:hypothetical protein [uncultured Propionibacterium sp.]